MVNKVVKKIFLKSMASILVMISAFSFFANACKHPFPRGCFRVFNIAIIGSDLVNGKPKDQSIGNGISANKVAMDALCRVGTKLEEFDGAEVLNDNKISFAGRELPRASTLIERNIFCFYDIANVYNADILRECPYAICPYRVDTAEVYDAWTERMTRLRDFVKKEDNKWCDLRFLGIIEGDDNEEVGKYITTSQQLACGLLDIYEYQQTVNTAWMFSTSIGESCAALISEIVTWDREELFKKCAHKNFPKIISNEGMKPLFSKIDQAPTSSRAPTAEVVVPHAGETHLQSLSTSSLYAIADEIYRQSFQIWCTHEGERKFKHYDMLFSVMQHGFNKHEILEGLKLMRIGDVKGNYRLIATIQAFFGHNIRQIESPPTEPEIQECFKIFGDQELAKHFKGLFEQLLRDGCTEGQLRHILDCSFEIKDYDWDAGGCTIVSREIVPVDSPKISKSSKRGNLFHTISAAFH